MTKEQAAAYHETGHAVVAMHFKYTVEKITIVEDDESEAHVLIKYSPGRLTSKRLIMIPLAGYLAEMVFDPSIPDDAKSWRADREEAAKLSARYKPEHLTRLMKETHRLIKRLWPLITLIAEELVKRETLTSEELEDLLSKGPLHWPER